MRESVKKLLSGATPDGSVSSFDRDRSIEAFSKWANKRVAAEYAKRKEAENKAKRDVEEVQAKLAKAEKALESAKEQKEKALAAAAKAKSDKETLAQAQGAIEAREAHARSQAMWAQEHTASAQKAMHEAMERQAEAESARDVSIKDADAAKQNLEKVKLELGQQIHASMTEAEKLRADLMMSEGQRASHAAMMSKELERVRSQVNTISGVLDVVPNRNDRGLLTHLDVQIGTDRFRVVPVRNASGLIVEMRREEI